jgi:hypothetical protein
MYVHDDHFTIWMERLSKNVTADDRDFINRNGDYWDKKAFAEATQQKAG